MSDMARRSDRLDLEAWAFGQHGRPTVQFLRLAKPHLPGSHENVRLVRRGTIVILACDERRLIFRLHHADELPQIEANLRLTFALFASGAPLVPPLDPYCLVDGDAVLTTWPQGEPADEESFGALGRTLSKLHATEPAERSPRVEIAQRMGERLRDLDQDVPKWIRESLASHARQDIELLAEISTEPLVALHGDAHVGNLAEWHGEWSLIDLDDLCVGPREFDLVPSFVSIHRFHRDSRSWDEFRSAYGDADWSLVERSSLMREATMNTWLAGLWSRSSRAREELQLRIRTWDEPPAQHPPWAPL